MKKSIFPFLIFSTLSIRNLYAQHLKPGFDKSECIEFLEMGSKLGDSAYQSKIPEPLNFKMIYRSKVVGLDNCWDLWTNNNGIAVISLRGTTTKAESWLANFYAAMVSAKGEIDL